MTPKIVLITGGTSGIGLAIAKVLSENSFIVYAAGRKFPDINPHSKLIFSYIDVTKTETIDSLVDEIFSKHHKIDILINCAGVGVAGAIEEIPVIDSQQAFDINYFGVLRTIQLIVPVMRKNSSGLIINISSIAGVTAIPFQGIYSSTKFALEGMTEALSMELKPFGIKVCMIEPGDYKTNVHLSRITKIPKPESPYYMRTKGYFDKINQNITKGRDPQFIGKLVLKISNKRNPKLRYKSGRFFETITPVVQKITPVRIFEKILTGFYKI